jgi:hypothetical protein
MPRAAFLSPLIGDRRTVVCERCVAAERLWLDLVSEVCVIGAATMQ